VLAIAFHRGKDVDDLAASFFADLEDQLEVVVFVDFVLVIQLGQLRL
jgi:hypothetical protein